MDLTEPGHNRVAGSPHECLTEKMIVKTATHCVDASGKHNKGPEEHDIQKNVFDIRMSQSIPYIC